MKQPSLVIVRKSSCKLKQKLIILYIYIAALRCGFVSLLWIVQMYIRMTWCCVLCSSGGATAAVYSSHDLQSSTNIDPRMGGYINTKTTSTKTTFLKHLPFQYSFNERHFLENSLKTQRLFKKNHHESRFLKIHILQRTWYRCLKKLKIPFVSSLSLRDNWRASIFCPTGHWLP